MRRRQRGQAEGILNSVSKLFSREPQIQALVNIESRLNTPRSGISHPDF